MHGRSVGALFAEPVRPICVIYLFFGYAYHFLILFFVISTIGPRDSEIRNAMSRPANPPGWYAFLPIGAIFWFLAASPFAWWAMRFPYPPPQAMRRLSIAAVLHFLPATLPALCLSADLEWAYKIGTLPALDAVLFCSIILAVLEGFAAWLTIARLLPAACAIPFPAYPAGAPAYPGAPLPPHLAYAPPAPPPPAAIPKVKYYPPGARPVEEWSSESECDECHQPPPRPPVPHHPHVAVGRAHSPSHAVVGVGPVRVGPLVPVRV